MQLFLKRALDIAAAGAIWLLLSPVYICLRRLVWVKLGTPVYFRQTRIGRDGKAFELIKFRTMTDARDTSGNLLPDSARLTPFGRWLRATSLDELPGLWNVIKGDMSLVGPRPLLPEYLPYYTETELTRHRMRPGITGLAQVSGRNAIGWDARLALDVEYVRTFSLMNDFKILWRTVAVVLNRHGISAEGHATMQRLDVERTLSHPRKP